MSPEINALSTIMFVVILGIILITNYLDSRSYKKRAAAAEGGGARNEKICLCFAVPVHGRRPCGPLPAAAGEELIQVTDDIAVSAGYDWTRFKGQNVSLNVYNWGLYISDGSDESVDVLAAFQELTGIKVNYTTYDTNESMYAKLKSGGASYDVIVPSDYMIGKMVNEDMLEPLNMANIPNFASIGAAYKGQSYDPADAYSVPYM